MRSLHLPPFPNNKRRLFARKHCCIFTRQYNSKYTCLRSMNQSLRFTAPRIISHTPRSQCVDALCLSTRPPQNCRRTVSHLYAPKQTPFRLCARVHIARVRQRARHRAFYGSILLTLTAKWLYFFLAPRSDVTTAVFFWNRFSQCFLFVKTIAEGVFLRGNR